VDLWFEDECHFQQHGSRCTMWIPPEEKDPVVLHAPTRKSVAFFGAVRPIDGRLMTFQIEKFNAENFGRFIEMLMYRKRRNRKVVLVLDNARWHHAAALDPLLAEFRKFFRLDFLPPYSPELNPIERVWKLTRRLCTHNQHFEFLDDLIATVNEQLDLWKKPNPILCKLCAIT
jgi:transposase